MAAGLNTIPFSIERLTAGSLTSYTLNFQCFGVKNSDVYVELQNQPVTALAAYTEGDFTYSIAFNFSDTVISFWQNNIPTPPDDGQVMVVRGYKT